MKKFPEYVYGVYREIPFGDDGPELALDEKASHLTDRDTTTRMACYKLVGYVDVVNQTRVGHWTDNPANV